MPEPLFQSAQPAWRPMKEAPRNRSILLRAQWNGYPVALVGRYVSEHGTWCTLPIFGQAEAQIFAAGWTDIPELEGVF